MSSHCFIKVRSHYLGTSFGQIYASTKAYHAEQKEAFDEKLNGVQEVLPKGNNVIVMGDANILLEHMIGRHNLEDRNYIGGRFVVCCRFHRLVIDGILFLACGLS